MTAGCPLIPQQVSLETDVVLNAIRERVLPMLLWGSRMPFNLGWSFGRYVRSEL